MLLPVAVGVVRFLLVAGVGLTAVRLGWPVEVVFAAVAAGLAWIGIGTGACLRSRAWRPDAQLTVT